MEAIDNHSDFLTFQSSLGIEVRSCTVDFANYALQLFINLEAKSGAPETISDAQVNEFRDTMCMPCIINGHPHDPATIEAAIRSRYGI